MQSDEIARREKEDVYVGEEGSQCQGEGREVGGESGKEDGEGEGEEGLSWRDGLEGSDGESE